MEMRRIVATFASFIHAYELSGFGLWKLAEASTPKTAPTGRDDLIFTVRQGRTLAEIRSSTQRIVAAFPGIP